MKKVIYFILCSFTVLINISCEGMDENYKDYRDEHPTYSPAVTEVNAISPEAGSLTLTWTFPKTDRIKSVEIVYKESSTKSESVEVGMKTVYTLSGLLLQSYTFEIYTIDIYGNRSIPIIKNYTPIPGREG